MKVLVQGPSSLQDIFKSPLTSPINMTDSPSSLLPPLRRVVTTHDAKGLATVESNVVLEPEVSLIDQFRSGLSRCCLEANGSHSRSSVSSFLGYNRWTSSKRQ